MVVAVAAAVVVRRSRDEGTRGKKNRGIGLACSASQSSRFASKRHTAPAAVPAAAGRVKVTVTVVAAGVGPLLIL